MFCEITEYGFILNYLIYVGIFIVSCVIAFKIHVNLGLIGILLCFISYFVTMAKEFINVHIGHGLISLLPILLLIAFIIYACIDDAKKEKIRNYECSLLPGRIDNYIMCNGFTAPHLFKKYSEEQPEFAAARSVQYTNPVYTMKVKENEQRRANNQQPLEITVPSLISYSSFAEYKYKEFVLTQFMLELPKTMCTIYMFDYGNLYDAMTTFQNFFRRENDTVDMIYFQQASLGVIQNALNNNDIEKVGGNGNLFRSTTIPEEDGNVVEGEEIVL